MVGQQQEDNSISIYDADRATHINSKVMRILTLIPEFQRDVERIRQDPDYRVFSFDISQHQEEGDVLSPAQRMEAICLWFKERGFQPFQDAHKAPSLRNDFLKDPFIDVVKRLANKFNLPYQFYRDAFTFLTPYIVIGWITVPSREEIPQYNNKKTRARVKEFEDNFALVQKSLRVPSSKDSDSYYIDRYAKGKFSSEVRAIRKAEGLSVASRGKRHKQTLSKVSEDAGKKVNSVVKARKRLDALARSLFGYGFLS